MDDLGFDQLMNSDNQDYWIHGDTFPVKDELLGWGCYWVVKKRLWRVDCTDKDDVIYKAIKELGVDLIPVVKNETQKKISAIMDKK